MAPFSELQMEVRCFHQASGTNNFLWGVSFSDTNNGIAVGEAGTILRTTDAGQTWVSQASGTSNGLVGASLIGTNAGVAVGSLGEIVHTTNGGTRWVNQSSAVTMLLLEVVY